MAIKVMMSFAFSGVGPYRPGPSETLYYLGSATTTADPGLNTAVVQLFNARMNMMAQNVQGILYRLSVPGVPRSTNTVYAVGTPNAPTPLLQTGVAAYGGAEIPNASLKITAKSAQAQPRNMYLSGLPDTLFSTGAIVGPNPSAPGLDGWQAAYTIWSNMLTNGLWGTNFLNRLPVGQPVNIAYWQQSTVAPFNLQIVLPNTSVYLPTVGSIVHIRKTLMGVSGVAKPIGKWRVKLTGAVDANNTYFELDQSSTFTAALIQQPGTVESVTFGFQPFVSLSNFLQTSRKRGVGPVRPRGRSRPRLRRQAS